jgi:DNA polymerase III epsilon subunit-like protein
MRLLFVDIETTGFDRTWDFIIEIAAVLYNTDLKKEVTVFHEYIKPAKKIPRIITEITGITDEFVSNCRKEEDVLKDFIAFIKNYEPDAIVAHNYDAFDGDFFKRKASFYFQQWPVDLKTIDTLRIARQLKVPTTMLTPKGAPSYKQESIAAAYGIKYNAHSALEDVRALIQIYNKMVTPSNPQNIQTKRTKLGF